MTATMTAINNRIAHYTLLGIAHELEHYNDKKHQDLAALCRTVADGLFSQSTEPREPRPVQPLYALVKTEKKTRKKPRWTPRRSLESSINGLLNLALNKPKHTFHTHQLVKCLGGITNRADKAIRVARERNLIVKEEIGLYKLSMKGVKAAHLNVTHKLADKLEKDNAAGH